MYEDLEFTGYIPIVVELASLSKAASISLYLMLLSKKHNI